MKSCPLCHARHETVLWRDRSCRVILAGQPGYPAFCRVIWKCHVSEMTDLSSGQREHLMRVVFAAERVLRRLMAPRKINLASLGNEVPHLHWHVIPRFDDDAHFPAAIWAVARRAGSLHSAEPEAMAQELRKLLDRRRAGSS